MTRARVLAALVGLAAFVGLAALLAPWHRVPPRGSGPPTAADPWSAAEVSRATHQVAAPVIELQDLLGNRIGLRQLHGRIVLVYFWGSW